MATNMRRLAVTITLCCAVPLVAACGSTSSPGTSATLTPPSSSASPGSGQPTAAAPSSSAASPHVAGPRPCATANLRVKLGPSEGAAGSIYQTIDFTNTGSASCTLYGYPGVSLTGGSPPAQIGQAAARSTTTSATLVTLAPGATANAVLQVTQAGNYPAATCDPVPAAALVIYPPNQTASVSIPYATTGCSAKSITILHASTVQSSAGQSGSGG